MTTAVVVRDLSTGHEIQLKGAPKEVLGAVFTPDGKYVLALPDRDPIVWRIDRPDAPVAHLKSGPVNEISTGRGDRMLTSGRTRPSGCGTHPGRSSPSCAATRTR